MNQTIQKPAGHFDRGMALSDVISSKLDDVISLIDDEKFIGGEKELTISYQEPIYPASTTLPNQSPVWGERTVVKGGDVALRGGGIVARDKATRGANQVITNTITTNANYFSKVNLYANSRLPANLPPLKVYIPTYPLVCLAAKYSQRVYAKPLGSEKETHVESNWRLGTKAMVIKSVPVDDMNTIVFAIRGTQAFFDWTVNLKSAPASPKDFLDDPSNRCHAGFLDVARKMVKPVAARLRQMLEENPDRASCSLLITGHSAGGAVASLLFCHMLSEVVTSELTYLNGCFKRVHCITFGAPPISLRPLSKPLNRERHLRKSLFLSFINEGDPVPRADRAYIRSLLDLYASPAPRPATRPLPPPNGIASASKLDLNLRTAKQGKNHNHSPKPPLRPVTAPSVPQSSNKPQVSNIIWPVPPSTLSGRLVVLRNNYNGYGHSTGERLADASSSDTQENVGAYIATLEQMGSVVFGDPLMHQMMVYRRRVEIIATKAVIGG